MYIKFLINQKWFNKNLQNSQNEQNKQKLKKGDIKIKWSEYEIFTRHKPQREINRKICCKNEIKTVKEQLTPIKWHKNKRNLKDRQRNFSIKKYLQITFQHSIEFCLKHYKKRWHKAK